MSSNENKNNVTGLDDLMTEMSVAKNVEDEVGPTKPSFTRLTTPPDEENSTPITTTNSSSNSSNSSTMFILHPIPTKGHGLIATQCIPKGTRILSEIPLFTIPNNSDWTYTPLEFELLIRSKVSTLTPSKQTYFLTRHSAFKERLPMKDLPYTAIFCTNALPCADDNSSIGIFEQACRINHACDNNGFMAWNDTINMFTVHAMRDIEEGEEITIYYIGGLTPRKHRQEELQRSFEFVCTCGLCSLPAEESDAIDQGLMKILDLKNMMEGWDFDKKWFEQPLETLQGLDELVQLHSAFGPECSRVGSGLRSAAELANRNGDLARARVFLTKSLEIYTILLGNDHPRVLEIEKDIQYGSNDQWYGETLAWKTDVSDIPRDRKDIENWLWKREEAGE